jgi:hypothetical protein
MNLLQFKNRIKKYGDEFFAPPLHGGIAFARTAVRNTSELHATCRPAETLSQMTDRTCITGAAKFCLELAA